MIDLQQLPAAEAERLAYAEGFTGTAALFARIAELEHAARELIDRLEDMAIHRSHYENLENLLP